MRRTCRAVLQRAGEIRTAYDEYECAETIHHTVPYMALAGDGNVIGIATVKL